MVTVAMAPPGSIPLLKAGNRQCSLRGEDDPMINQRTGSGKKANNPAGAHLKTEEPPTTTQLCARTVGARLGHRAVYSWKVQVPQTFSPERWTLVSSTA